MMTEHMAIIEKQVSVQLSLGEIFAAANQIIDNIPSSDVRWKHVERAQKIHEKLLQMFTFERQEKAANR